MAKGSSKKVLKGYIENVDNPVAQIVAGSGYGNYTGSSDTARDVMMGALNQEYALQSMERANEYNIEAEKRANEYNSIGAQMERADQAGVSRIAALGQSTGQTISSMSPVAGTTPRSASRSARAPEIAQMVAGAIGQGLDIYKRVAEVKNLNQNTALQSAQTDNQVIRNQIADATKASQINIARLQEQGIDISNQQKNFDYQMSQISAPIDLQAKQQAVKKAWAETFSTYYLARKQGQVADSQISLDTSRIHLNGVQGGLYKAQTEDFVQSSRLKGAQTLLAASEKELKDICVSLTKDKETAQELENDINKFRNEFEKEHKEKDWKRERSNAVWNNVNQSINAGSSLIKSVCFAVGTATTGGQGGVLAGADVGPSAQTKSALEFMENYGYMPY